MDAAAAAESAPAGGAAAANSGGSMPAATSMPLPITTAPVPEMEGGGGGAATSLPPIGPGCRLDHWLLPSACILPPPAVLWPQLLGRWERQSQPLAVNSDAQKAMMEFLPYFKDVRIRAALELHWSCTRAGCWARWTPLPQRRRLPPTPPPPLASPTLHQPPQTMEAVDDPDMQQEVDLMEKLVTMS